MNRSFKDFVSRPTSLRKRLAQVLSGSIAGLGVTSANAAPVAAVVAPTVDPPAVTIANRSEKANKLLLRMPNGLSYSMLLHRSHSSHASHRSHASHYSGSGGGGTVAAPRVETPRTTSGTAETPPPSALTPAAITWFTGTVDAIDVQNRTFTVKTSTTAKYVLSYRDDTTIRSTRGEESRLDEAMEKNSGKLPFEKGQKLKVSWKTGPNGKVIATAIAPPE